MITPIGEVWINSTVRIENPWGLTGTGFFLGRQIGQDSYRVFLVTNKHVIGTTEEERKQAETIDLHVNMPSNSGGVRRQLIHCRLPMSSPATLVREHTDPDVDVLAIDVTALWGQGLSLGHSFLLDTPNIPPDSDIVICDEVVLIGYPVGIQHHSSNYPIARQGMIASIFGETLEDEVTDENKLTRKRVVRGFLVDGGIVPGLSGSPVISKPGKLRYSSQGMHSSASGPSLLGIVSETTYASVKAERFEGHAFADLGIALYLETIRETLDLFFAERVTT